MTYYVGTMPVGEHLSHHGIKGMRWGQRRFQNPDGSLTAAGRVRYGVSNAYSRARSGVRSAGNRTSSWYKKNKKTIKKVGTAVGASAAAAGATYLGMRYGKSALKVAKGLRNKRIQPNALKNISKAQNAYSRFKSGASAFGSKAKNVGKRAAGATGDAFRGIGYHTRRAGAKAKNAARNVGYKAGNAPYFMKRTAQRAGGAVKNAARNVGYKAGNAPYFMKRTAQRAGGAVKNAAKKAPRNAKSVAYNLKNNKAYRHAAAARGINAAGKAAAGAYWYGVSKRYGASKKGAAAIGAARTFGGRRAALGVAGAEGMYNFVKRANSPSVKRARARRKKKSRK